MSSRRRRVAIIKDFAMKRKAEVWVVGWEELASVEDIEDIKVVVQQLNQEDMPNVGLVRIGG